MINACSRFLEVDIVASTSAISTIPKLEIIFVAAKPPPPPFQKLLIQKFMKENEIKYQRTTPLWPQSISEAESKKPVVILRALYKSIQKLLTSQHYNIFLISQYFANKLCSFTRYMMLFHVGWNICLVRSFWKIFYSTRNYVIRLKRCKNTAISLEYYIKIIPIN